MYTNYKNLKQTNQSQKGYKLKNNLIILRDSIKNLTYLTILTIIVLLRDNCFGNCFKDFLKKDCKKERKCFNNIKKYIIIKTNINV